jgi:hypothetical protein
VHRSDHFTFYEVACRDRPVEPLERIEPAADGWRVRFASGNCRLHIDLSGEVRLTEDGRDIAYLAPGSRLHIIEYWDRVWPEGSFTSVDVDGLTASALGRKRNVRTLIVETGRSGALQIAYWVNGSPEHLDSGALNWLVRLVAELSLQTGMDAGNRDGSHRTSR